MEKIWSIRLIRFAALFGILGTFIGSQMSGSMDYSMRPIHAHILLVGWLSVFAWGIFYKVYKVKSKLLVAVHSWLAMLGAFGLTFGMWMYNLNPFLWDETLVMILFIVGGSLLLVAFLLFAIITFLIEKE
ncbi:hypothetical protein PUW24_12570 [Paenibacillus urinalis]|uniref:Cytochrome-c oxidase n=1 Tax=Paenibacillus urinalis TaxID=521520 RepID=A0AAX3N1M1_9BACL|nr:MULTISPECIES: hypothetical protein [Paenibacillus]WDH83621.1 hypothetical protein PUW23_05155 [Paenibacillus urinalis]WDH99650.1 hypothetical protein PUW24_12570 [Paenibacillus urinalis]WDI03282.1 hypothetical protein PUW25_04700 [Paenibacillus urinalis]GAK42386.1 hypothetical protein TCA2_4878 [Paenibacillus sp. TCA20]